MFWVLPLSTIAWVTYRYRPAPWTWPLMALCVAYIPTMVKVMHGNPFMWSAAAVALGTVYGWPALFVILKPSLAPFALVGAGHRSWWIGLIVVVASIGASVLLFGSVWRDYLTAMKNSRNPAGLLYSYTDVGPLLVPVIAYVGAREHGRHRPRMHRLLGDGRRARPSSRRARIGGLADLVRLGISLPC